MSKFSRDAGRAAPGAAEASGGELSETDIAMLELVEFGIDRWSSAASLRAIAALAEQGLVHVDGEGRTSLTAEGFSVLQAAKALGEASEPASGEDGTIDRRRRR